MCGGFFFFSSTNVETKHVCPIAYNNATADWLDFNIYRFKERIKPLTEAEDFYAKLAYQMRLASFELVRVCFEQQYKSDSTNAATEQKEQPTNPDKTDALIKQLDIWIENNKLSAAGTETREGLSELHLKALGRIDAYETVKWFIQGQ